MVFESRLFYFDFILLTPMLGVNVMDQPLFPFQMELK